MSPGVTDGHPAPAACAGSCNGESKLDWGGQASQRGETSVTFWILTEIVTVDNAGLIENCLVKQGYCLCGRWWIPAVCSPTYFKGMSGSHCLPQYSQGLKTKTTEHSFPLAWLNSKHTIADLVKLIWLPTPLTSCCQATALTVGPRFVPYPSQKKIRIIINHLFNKFAKYLRK